MTSSSDCFSLPTMGATSVVMSARIMWMDGAAGPQADAVPAALLDDLRFLQGQLLQWTA